MLTFQQNKTHTFKILAPNLELNCNQMPYVRSFFREISLSDDENKYDEINKIEKEKANDKNIIGLSEMDESLEDKEKNEKDELTKTLSESDLFSQIPQEKVDDYDINKNMENYDSSKRYKSMMQKSKEEKAAIRSKSVHSNKIKNCNTKSRNLNPNDSLENLVLQMKIYDLPEIFNICLMNNLSGLKSINIGNLDEITFIGFMNSYKNNCTKLINLTSLKITLGISIISYASIEKYILEFININSPKIEEKFLFSDLQMITESKMNELVELVYTQAVVPKLVIQISNVNEDKLSKILTKYINDKKVELNTLIILLDFPELSKVYNHKILDCLSSFFANNKNRVIICKEMPNTTSY